MKPCGFCLIIAVLGVSLAQGQDISGPGLSADVATAPPDSARWFKCSCLREVRRGEWVPQGD